MLYRARVTFTGEITMTMGEVREISDPSIVKDLLKAGYIELVGQEKKPTNKKAKY